MEWLFNSATKLPVATPLPSPPFYTEGHNKNNTNASSREEAQIACKQLNFDIRHIFYLSRGNKYHTTGITAYKDKR